MAQLIQFKNRPNKHHALKKDQVLTVNRAISDKKQHERTKFSLIFQEFEQQKTALFKTYLIKRNALEERAQELANKSITRRTLLRIIMILYRWHKTLESEADAMLLLAQKVAVSVLNCTHINRALADEKHIILRELKDYFHIIIVLPSTLTPTLKSLALNLEHYFAQLTFLTVDQHDKGAHMKIEWHGETRILALDDVDLGWALSRAIKNIIRFELCDNKA